MAYCPIKFGVNSSAAPKVIELNITQREQHFRPLTYNEKPKSSVSKK